MDIMILCTIFHSRYTIVFGLLVIPFITLLNSATKHIFYYFQVYNTHPVPAVPSSLFGVGGFVPPRQMAGMLSYMLHPHGIPQSLASPNYGVPHFDTFQPTVQPRIHWSNQHGPINREFITPKH
jgi:hypothetical protein